MSKNITKWHSVKEFLPARGTMVVVRFRYLEPDSEFEKVEDAWKNCDKPVAYSSASFGSYWKDDGPLEWKLACLPWNEYSAEFETDSDLSSEIEWEHTEHKDLVFKVTHWMYSLEQDDDVMDVD